MSDPNPHPTPSAARELADLRCRRQLTPRLVPYLNGGLVGMLAYALGWLVFACFERATWLGWLHLLVIAPLALWVGSMGIRVLIEFGLAVLEIRDHANELGTLPRRVSTWPAMRRIVALGESRVWATRRNIE